MDAEGHNPLTQRAGKRVKRMGMATDKLSKEPGYSCDHSIKIGTMWSIINPPGGTNRAHVHPDCL